MAHEIVDTRLLWKQETVHKAQDFIWWSEVLDVRGLSGREKHREASGRVAAHTVEHQLNLSVVPELVSKPDRVTSEEGPSARGTGRHLLGV